MLFRERDQVVLDVNPGFERTFGWRREEVLQRPLRDAVLPGLGGAFLGRMMRDGELRGVELRGNRRDGGAVEVQLSARTAGARR